LIDEAFQFFIQAASFSTLFMPALIVAVTIALIWFLRPGFFMGAVLSIAGFVLAVISSFVLQVTLGMLYLSVVASILFADNQATDAPGQPSSNSYDIRYRLDVNLLVDGEPITGSVVHALISPKGATIPALGISPQRKFYGQALVLDLPGGRPNLIVPTAGGGRLFQQGITDEEAAYSPVITKERFGNLFFSACGFYTFPRSRDWTLGGSETQADWYIRVNSFKGTCEVTPQFMPLLYSIDDNYDVSTIQLADPNNLAARFGSGVEFVSASVSVVDDPVSTDVLQIFPWIAPLMALKYSGPDEDSKEKRLRVIGETMAERRALAENNLTVDDLFRRKL